MNKSARWFYYIYINILCSAIKNLLWCLFFNVNFDFIHTMITITDECYFAIVIEWVPWNYRTECLKNIIFCIPRFHFFNAKTFRQKIIFECFQPKQCLTIVKLFNLVFMIFIHTKKISKKMFLRYQSRNVMSSFCRGTSRAGVNLTNTYFAKQSNFGAEYFVGHSWVFDKLVPNYVVWCKSCIVT